jgi:glycosyltransferase involved in cell wall biosynthesis
MLRPGRATTNVLRDATATGGGMAAVALPLHRALLDQQVNARFICGLPPEQKVPNLYVAGPTGRGFPSLENLLGGVVHIHGLWTPFVWRAQREAKTNRARLIISPHGALEPWALAHKRLKKLAAWKLYQRKVVQGADLLVVSSEQEHDQLRRLGLSPPIAIIPSGVDLPDGLLDTQEFTTLKRMRIVLFFARLSPAKGIPDLLQAWHGLEDRRGYELHIHGFGEVGYRDFLEAKVNQLGLAGDVKILGPLYGEEKWRKFRTSSIYVLPSYNENFGITVAEALSAGLPVITTRATPWGHLAKRGLGWIVENDIGQLRRALNEATSLPADELEAIGEKARDYAATNFSWRMIVEQYLKTYEWVSGRTPSNPDWVSVVRCAS